LRRAIVALLGTVAGTVLMVGAKFGTPVSTNTAEAQADPATGASAPGGETTDPSASPTVEVSGSTVPTTAGPGTPGTTTAPAPPQTTTHAPSCKTVSGNPASLKSPGVGAMTVTIKVCDGALSTSSGALSRSNWEPTNKQAMPVLNSLVVKYYKTDLSQIHYSNATLTSNAYQTSLKSALGKAGI
jgi:uncharacterized protein with FMN-binding domain